MAAPLSPSPARPPYVPSHHRPPPPPQPPPRTLPVGIAPPYTRRERYNQALNTRWRIAPRRPDLAQPAGRTNGGCRLLYNARDRDSNNTQRAGTVRLESNESDARRLTRILRGSSRPQRTRSSEIRSARCFEVADREDNSLREDDERHMRAIFFHRSRRDPRRMNFLFPC